MSLKVCRTNVLTLFCFAAKRLGNWGVDVTDDKLLQEVTDAFNYSLKFDPEDARMAYTVRDPIAAGKLITLLHNQG